MAFNHIFISLRNILFITFFYKEPISIHFFNFKDSWWITSTLFSDNVIKKIAKTKITLMPPLVRGYPRSYLVVLLFLHILPSRGVVDEPVVICLS